MEKSIMRDCGDCQVCCFEPLIPEMNSAAHSRCPAQGDSCCTQYDTRPERCRIFNCAWLRGFGLDDQRPNVSGLLVDIMDLNDDGHPFIFAKETKKNGLMNGMNVVTDLVTEVKLPAIVCDYNILPPMDTGDRVVVSEELISRTSQMRGELLNQSGKFGIYKLVKESA